MSGIRPRKRCGLYRPGHEIHYIQMRKSSEDRENPRLLGRLIECRSDGTVVIEIEGREISLWSHEPERVAESVAANDGVVRYQKRWGLLWGSDCFCVASADHVPCPDSPPTGTPLELLKSAGGFILPLSLLRDGSS